MKVYIDRNIKRENTYCYPLALSFSAVGGVSSSTLAAYSRSLLSFKERIQNFRRDPLHVVQYFANMGCPEGYQECYSKHGRCPVKEIVEEPNNNVKKGHQHLYEAIERQWKPSR